MTPPSPLNEHEEEWMDKQGEDEGGRTPIFALIVTVGQHPNSERGSSNHTWINRPGCELFERVVIDRLFGYIGLKYFVHPSVGEVGDC